MTTANPSLFCDVGETQAEYHTDITLRDLFAGMAMPQLVDGYPEGREESETTDWTLHRINTAREAYRIADAMLEARSK